MERLLLASAVPLLADVQLSVPEVQLELYPARLPDVYCGQPLLVAGKYEGEWPEEVLVTGSLSNGAGEACGSSGPSSSTGGTKVASSCSHLEARDPGKKEPR